MEHINNERENLLNNEGLKKSFESSSKDSVITVTETLTVCLVYVLSLILMTFLMFFLIRLNWSKLLNFILSSTIAALFVVSGLFWLTMAASFDLTVDSITTTFFMYNIVMLAFFSIMWSAPKILNQTYQIYFAVLIAWYIDTLTPIWIGWGMLAILSIWDLFAVLPEYGPLNMIIKILDKRGQKLPNALIYSVYFDWPAMKKLKLAKQLKSNNQNDLELNTFLQTNENNNNNNERGPIRIMPVDSIDAIETTQSETKIDDDDDDGPKLGIGDFVFYSVLIAKSATQLNLTTVFACFLTIIVGLTITMSLVAYLSRPLPALPISIFLAMIVFFGNEYFGNIFCNRLSLNQIFI